MRAMYIVTALIVAEVIALLLVPTMYCTYFNDNTASNNLHQSFPLTQNQIKSSWVNLPNAQTLWNDCWNKTVLAIVDTRWYNISSDSQPNKIMLTSTHYWSGTTVNLIIQNTTDTNIPNMMYGGVIPRFYHIWLQYNETVWIEVPQSYLANTNNPPLIPPQKQDNFLGTNIPIIQAGIGIAVIIITIVASLSYLLLKHRYPKTEVSSSKISS